MKDKKQIVVEQSITVQDDFLTEPQFLALKEHVENNDYSVFDAGDKKFSYMEVPFWILQELKLKEDNLFMAFIRRAWSDFDTDPRIHADNIIRGHRTSVARVLYLSDNETVSENGTCFYSHMEHGEELPDNVSPKEYDRMLGEDSNDVGKWELLRYVKAKPNRMLTYNANLFHSKFPFQISKGTREVLVCFYTKENVD